MKFSNICKPDGISFLKSPNNSKIKPLKTTFESINFRNYRQKNS